MQSVQNPTFSPRLNCWSSKMRKRSATGFSVILGLGLPLGRPRCDARISRAPWRRAYSMVGSVSRMRVSSMTPPSSPMGTLKSTRMKMRCPPSGRSRIESFAIPSSSAWHMGTARITAPQLQPGLKLKPFVAHEVNEVAHPARVAPLVVVPGNDFDQLACDHARHGRVHDGRARISAEVYGDQLFRFVPQIAL